MLQTENKRFKKNIEEIKKICRSLRLAEPKRVERLRKNERSIYYYGDILHNKTKLELFQAEAQHTSKK